MRIKHLFAVLITLSCGAFVTVSAAESKQAFEVEADSAEYDYETGVSIYRGKVMIRKGSLYLTGNMMEVTFDGDNPARIILRGTPSTFEDHLSKGDIYMEAKKIDYDGRNRIIRMYDDVVVNYAGSIFRGNYIVYDMDKEFIQAPKRRGRVRLTIDPERGTER